MDEEMEMAIGLGAMRGRAGAQKRVPFVAPARLTNVTPSAPSASQALISMLVQQAQPTVKLAPTHYYWASATYGPDIGSSFGLDTAIIAIVDTNLQKNGMIKVVWAAPKIDPKTGKPFDWVESKYFTIGNPVTEQELKNVGLAGLPEEHMDEEMEMAIGLGAAMALAPSRFSTSTSLHEVRPERRHGGVPSGSTSAPVPPGNCPPGYGTYYIYKGIHGQVQVFGPLGPKDIHPVGIQGSYYECRPLPQTLAPGGAFTAAESFRRARMQQLTPGTQPSITGGRPWPRRPQVSPLGVHGLPEGLGDDMTMQDDLQFAAGLGAEMVTVGLGTLRSAAIAMNNALNDGYHIYDMPLYSAFQSEAGLTADGYPGEGTMVALNDALADLNIALAIGTNANPVRIYPWKKGAYDGVNAPPLAEWTRAQGGGGGAVPAPPPAKPPPKQPLAMAGKTDYTTPILIGAGVLGVGIIGYALYRRKKGHRRAA